MTKAKRQKFYVVWVGQDPGIYDNWAECFRQVANFPNARYKSFASREEAVDAYRNMPEDNGNFFREMALRRKTAQAEHKLAPRPDFSSIPGIRLDAIAVDGACAGNPGRMEYRAVRVIDGAEVFHIGAQKALTGTNNIAEYLAMIHLAALLKKAGDNTTPIYTDSKNTLAWLKKGRSKTTLERTEATAETLDLLARADAWLAANEPIANPILKWQTDMWGEIPADFGRK